MKHTQGEWKYAGGDDGSCEINIGDTTASICRWEKNSGEYVISREEMEANAKLIAAAPELLAFAVEMVKRYPNSPWILEQGSAAIKKATY